MSQSKQTRQSDYVAPPTIGGTNRVQTFTAGAAAAAQDLHANINPSGLYTSFYNAGPGTAFIAFDSTSGGTAVTAATGVPIPPGTQRDFLLTQGRATSPVDFPVYPNRYAKHIATGGNAVVSWWVSAPANEAGV